MDAEVKIRDELDLVLEHKGIISKTRIQAILNIAFDSIYVNNVLFHLIVNSK